MNKEKKDIVSGNKTATLNYPLMISVLSNEPLILPDFFILLQRSPIIYL